MIRQSASWCSFQPVLLRGLKKERVLLKMLKKKRISIMSVLIFLVLHITQTTHVKGDELLFKVQPNIPSNQVNMDSPWYDLLLEPGETQTLTMLITNLSGEELVVIPEISQATTTPFGKVDYVPNDIPLDSTVEHNMADLINVPKTVVVPPSATSTLEMELQMPDEPFEGMLAAGITISEQESASEIDDKPQITDVNHAGMVSKNRFRFCVAILLRNELTRISPDLNLIGAAAGHFNFRNVVNAHIQNPKARFLSGVEIYAEVMNKSTGAVVFDSAIGEPGVQFAPNSTMQFPVPLNGQRFVPGWYTIRVKAISPDEEWDLESDFEITEEEAIRLNAEDLTIVNDDLHWEMVLNGISILLTVVAIFLIVILMCRRAVQKAENDENEDAYEQDYGEYEEGI